jgi:hypothetical protein
VTDDVRSGDDVQVHDGDIAISVRGASVRYRLDGGVLLRETHESGERTARPIARRVAAFTVEPVGALHAVTLELDRRDRRSAGRARVSARVACRAGAAQ